MIWLALLFAAYSTLATLVCWRLIGQRRLLLQQRDRLVGLYINNREPDREARVQRVWEETR